jgi:hypothetical protein
MMFSKPQRTHLNETSLRICINKEKGGMNMKGNTTNSRKLMV